MSRVDLDSPEHEICSDALAARDHEIAALKRIIENGRAAHNEDRVARDWLARDRDAWRARAERAEADLRDANEWRDKLADKIIELEAATSRGRELVDDANERATQAEAQVAAMLKAAAEWRDRPCRGGLDPCVCCEEANDHMPDDEYVVGGRALLVELEALREVERVTLARVQNAVPEWAPEIRSALAAVDAARKGE